MQFNKGEGKLVHLKYGVVHVLHVYVLLQPAWLIPDYSNTFVHVPVQEKPPSTTRLAPEMNDALSEARYNMAAVVSLTSPIRPIGYCFSYASVPKCAVIDVLIRPGL